jgi:hypothetical protein
VQAGSGSLKERGLVVIIPRIGEFLKARSPVQREALLLAAGFAFGVLIMPLFIWVAGQLILGPYAHGGPLALLADHVRALASGSLSSWVVALFPYLAGVVARWIASRWRAPPD